MKYLVVDDSRMARKMLLRALKDLQIDDGLIIECSNGQEAVEQYKQNEFDICFMDLTMPVLNGFEATKAICEYDKNARIIIVSADIQDSSMKIAKENGAIGFIKKPVNGDNLSIMLKKLGLI